MCCWFRGEDNPTMLNHFFTPQPLNFCLVISAAFPHFILESLWDSIFILKLYGEGGGETNKHGANEKTALFCLLWKITITSCSYPNRSYPAIQR